MIAGHAADRLRYISPSKPPVRLTLNRISRPPETAQLNLQGNPTSRVLAYHGAFPPDELDPCFGDLAEHSEKTCKDLTKLTAPDRVAASLVLKRDRGFLHGHDFRSKSVKRRARIVDAAPRAESAITLSSPFKCGQLHLLDYTKPSDCSLGELLMHRTTVCLKPLHSR